MHGMQPMAPTSRSGPFSARRPQSAVVRGPRRDFYDNAFSHEHHAFSHEDVPVPLKATQSERMVSGESEHWQHYPRDIPVRATHSERMASGDGEHLWQHYPRDARRDSMGTRTMDSLTSDSTRTPDSRDGPVASTKLPPADHREASKQQGDHREASKQQGEDRLSQMLGGMSERHLLEGVYKEMREGFKQLRTEMQEVRSEHILEQVKYVHAAMVRADSDTRARLVEMRRLIEQMFSALDSGLFSEVRDLKDTLHSTVVPSIHESKEELMEMMGNTLLPSINESKVNLAPVFDQLEDVRMRLNPLQQIVDEIKREVDEIKPTERFGQVHQDIRDMRANMVKPADDYGHVRVDFSPVLDEIAKMEVRPALNHVMDTLRSNQAASMDCSKNMEDSKHAIASMTFSNEVIKTRIESIDQAIRKAMDQPCLGAGSGRSPSPSKMKSSICFRSSLRAASPRGHGPWDRTSMLMSHNTSQEGGTAMGRTASAQSGTSDFGMPMDRRASY